MASIFVDNAGSNTSPYDTWAKAATTLTTALAGATNADTIYVTNTHSESTAGIVTLTCPASNGLKILCVTPSGASGNSGLNTGAIVAVGASSQFLTLDGHAYVYGIEFRGGTNSSASCSVRIGNATTAHALFLESCKLDLRTANTSAGIRLGPSANVSQGAVLIWLRSTQFKVADTAHSIALKTGWIYLQNISLDSAGAAPTTLFAGVTGSQGIALISEGDLSGKTWTNLVNAAWPASYQLTVRNVRLPASTALSTGTHSGPGGLFARLHDSDSGDVHTNFGDVQFGGTIVEETTLVRSGGGAVSYRFDTSASTLFPFPVLTMEGAIRNTSTGSAKTLTVPILHDSATNMQNDEIWLEIVYKGTSGYPQGNLDIDSRAADVLATPADQPSDSSTWTTTGMSNPNKQYLACTFTPQETGYVFFKVCAAPAAAKTVYVDMLGASIA